MCVQRVANAFTKWSVNLSTDCQSGCRFFLSDAVALAASPAGQRVRFGQETRRKKQKARNRRLIEFVAPLRGDARGRRCGQKAKKKRNVTPLRAQAICKKKAKVTALAEIRRRAEKWTKYSNK
jgi:hypothetical protein